MAEVFQGTPSIVNVAISDSEGRKVEYNVCGRGLDTVKDSIRKALEAMPDEDQNPEPKKARKARRTKVQLAAAKDLASQPKEEKTWP